MKLLRLELKHWCQHSHLDLTFPEEPIVLFCGPNNSGKSNLVRAIGRVLALGRSEFGDAADIQDGFPQANLQLTALTHERMPFTIAREIKRHQTRTRLEFAGQSLTNADEIQKQLQEWFGRQETFLDLFIAPQDQIARPLKERGKDRLISFIEICGFKGFLQKQNALNKFTRAYPTVNDPSPLLQDVQGRIGQLESRRAEQIAALQALPPGETLQLEINRLQETKTLRADTEKELAAKQQALTRAQADVAKPLPNLAELQRQIQSIRATLARSQAAALIQKVERTRGELHRAEQELEAVPVDFRDYPRLLQESSDALQTKMQRRNAIAEERRTLAQLRTELDQLEKSIAEHQATLANLTHSQNWYRLTLEQLSQLHTASHQHQAQEAALKQLRERLARHEQVQAPPPETLKARQASEARLQEILGLHRQLAAAMDQCPLCLHAWEKAAQLQRLKELEAQATALQADLKQSSGALAEYQRWVEAQAEIPRLRHEMQRYETEYVRQRRELETQLGALQLPAQEITEIPMVIAGYQKVKAALDSPTQLAETLREKIATASPTEQRCAAEDVELAGEIQNVNARLRELLEAQAVAHENARKAARLKSQVQMWREQLGNWEINLPEKPADYQAETDYAELCDQQEEELTRAQDTFQQASGDWASRFAQFRAVEGLKNEIESAEQKLQTLCWGAEQEVRLAEWQKSLNRFHQLQAGITVLETQTHQARAQLSELRIHQDRFNEQARNVADLEAVSRFLSYDNGPLKFLAGLFQEALNQTNLLLTEMEVPVKLHLGANLEIMVADRNSPSTSVRALGGGYSSLVGIAFRIALQRLVLPRVHVLILDEPSTHINETNMDLLLPFFEKLKGRLGQYGIEQCIVIDHHVGWRNTTSACIEFGPSIKQESTDRVAKDGASDSLLSATPNSPE